MLPLKLRQVLLAFQVLRFLSPSWLGRTILSKPAIISIVLHLAMLIIPGVLGSSIRGMTASIWSFWASMTRKAAGLWIRGSCLMLISLMSWSTVSVELPVEKISLHASLNTKARWVQSAPKAANSFYLVEIVD